MVAQIEEKSVVRTRLWLAIAITTSLLAYLLGYVISSKTGVEPGFFEQPEAGGYGVAAEKPAAAGLEKDVQDYYSDLVNE